MLATGVDAGAKMSVHACCVARASLVLRGCSPKSERAGIELRCNTCN